jgi:hypothetical protein
MTLDELDTSPGMVYSNPKVDEHVRLVFRSNVREPVKVTLDQSGDIISEEYHYEPEVKEGWEAAEPLKSTDIVRDDATFLDPPEVKVVAP